jgi:tRNA (guanine-N7-)-methyltransferase
MTELSKARLVNDEIEIVPANYFAPLNLETIYGRKAPLEVDLGCGEGSFLVETAGINPGRNFLGIERLNGRIGTAHRKIWRRGLTNTRLLRIEASYAVRQLLPSGSVTMFHLLFPDPWPKRRHWPRRVVTAEFLTSIYRALVPSGRLRVVTDDPAYFGEIQRLVSETTQFTISSDAEERWVPSTFEKKFIGSDIYRVLIRKVLESR